MGGFSQGAILTFGVALDPNLVRPAGVLNWCGGLPHNRGTPFDLERAAGLPVLWQMAGRDEVVPVEFSIAGSQALAEHGADLTVETYDSTHAVSVELLADAQRWLAMQ